MQACKLSLKINLSKAANVSEFMQSLLVSDTIRKRLLGNKMITEKTCKAMRCKSVRPGQLYMLPKIYKLNLPGRPIVSYIGISAFVDYVLPPFMSRDWIPSCIKDTTEFLQQLQILVHGQRNFGYHECYISLYKYST